MVCSRGAASPNLHTQKRLFAASAGYCHNPQCSRELFEEENGKSIHIAEMAHIFAASNAGPRAKSSLSKSDLGSFDNLLLLCANCHTRVDKAPLKYDDATILSWKIKHKVRLRSIFGFVSYKSRLELRSYITPFLLENQVIFQMYGPHILAAANPESGAAERWKRKMLSRILPNSSRIIFVLDGNRSLLKEDETLTLELFRQHVDDLYSYHIEGDKEDASQFPDGMARFLEDLR